MRRYDDKKEITWGGVKVLSEGNLEVYIGRRGSWICVPYDWRENESFSITEVLAWYADSLGLRDGDYKFPRLRGAGKDRVAKIGHKYVGYSASVAQLRRFCMINDISVLTMHSGRRVVVTVAVEMGMARNMIQVVGNWSSNAVDGYFYPLEPGVEFMEGLLQRL